MRYEFYGVARDANGKDFQLSCPMEETAAPFIVTVELALQTLSMVALSQGAKCPMKVRRFLLILEPDDCEGGVEITADSR